MRRRIFMSLVLLLGLADLIWLAAQPQPTGPAEGTTLKGPNVQTADRPRDSFCVGSFNIHGCTGADGRRDVDRVADCLKGLDFVALNEVHGPRPWETRRPGGVLGRRLGVPWLFAPATRDWHIIDFGNGLLTSLPVDSWRRIPLAVDNGHGYRNAVLVRLKQRDRAINVLLTHIARSDDHTRQQQLRQTIDLYLELPEPAIFLGDLNSEVAEPEIVRLPPPRAWSMPWGRSLDPAPRRESISSLSAACGSWTPASATTGRQTIPWPGPR